MCKLVLKLDKQCFAEDSQVPNYKLYINLDQIKQHSFILLLQLQVYNMYNIILIL